MMSTHYRSVRRQDEQDLRLIDLLARQTADIIDRARAEDMLKESEARFHHVFSNNMVAMALWKGSGEIYDANDAFLGLLGFSPDDLEAGRVRWDEVTPLEYHERDAQAVAEVWTTGTCVPYEKEYIHRDGHLIPIIIGGGVFDERAGTGVLFVMDNTDRKKMEEALKAERKRLYEVFDNLPAMICLLTPDHHVAYSNRPFKEQFGESNGRPCYEYCFGKLAPCDFCESFKVLETGKPHHWQVTTGEGATIDAYDVPFTDVDGSPLILELDLDITDAMTRPSGWWRKNGPAFQAILDAAPIGIFVGDADGATVMMNKAFDGIWKGPAPKPSGVSEYSEYKAWFADSGKKVEAEDWPTARALGGDLDRYRRYREVRRFEGRDNRPCRARVRPHWEGHRGHRGRPGHNRVEKDGERTETFERRATTICIRRLARPARAVENGHHLPRPTGGKVQRQA